MCKTINPIAHKVFENAQVNNDTTRITAYGIS